MTDHLLLLRWTVTLKAEREAKARKQEMQIAKLVVQLVTHTRCDHTNHQQQIDVSSIPSWAAYRRHYLRGSSIVLSLDARSQQIRLSAGGYLNINDYLQPGTPTVEFVREDAAVGVSSLRWDRGRAGDAQQR